MGIDLDYIYCLILGHADIKNYLKFYMKDMIKSNNETKKL